MAKAKSYKLQGREWTVKDLAEELGLSTPRVHGLLKEHNENIKAIFASRGITPKPADKGPKARLFDYKGKQWTVKQLAEEFGLSNVRVNRLIKEHDGDIEKIALSREKSKKADATEKAPKTEKTDKKLEKTDSTTIQAISLKDYLLYEEEKPKERVTEYRKYLIKDENFNKDVLDIFAQINMEDLTKEWGQCSSISFPIKTCEKTWNIEEAPRMRYHCYNEIYDTSLNGWKAAPEGEETWIYSDRDDLIVDCTYKVEVNNEIFNSFKNKFLKSIDEMNKEISSYSTRSGTPEYLSNFYSFLKNSKSFFERLIQIVLKDYIEKYNMQVTIDNCKQTDKEFNYKLNSLIEFVNNELPGFSIEIKVHDKRNKQREARFPDKRNKQIWENYINKKEFFISTKDFFSHFFGDVFDSWENDLNNYIIQSLE
jgi:DNA-binding Xre family transcriptional regulator